VHVAGFDIPPYSGKFRAGRMCVRHLLILSLLLLPGRLLVAAEAAEPATYLRIDESRTNVVRLQTAMRRLVPVKGDGPAIWLGAVTHLGATNYYRAFEKLLSTNDVVLFEAVLPHKKGGWSGAEFSRVRQASPPAANLQSELAHALRLGFQLEVVDYSPANFRNSDLSMEAVQGLMLAGMQRVAAAAADTNEESPEPGEDGFSQLMAVMEGRGFVGRLVSFGVEMLAADPRAQAKTKLMFIEVLGRLKGDLAKAQALPEGMGDLLKVLIHRRNQKVTRDLRKTLMPPDAPASIAVFYGAGHMADLERRVRGQLGYRPDHDVWLTAFEVDLVEYGITRWERELIRFMTERQMQMLQPADDHE